MKVINTYIVQYSDSYAQGELAILLELEDGNYLIKYEGFERERIEPIDKMSAKSLIK